MTLFRNVLALLVVTSFVISLVESESRKVGKEKPGRIRREMKRGKKAALVRRLLKNGRRIREGSVRLMDGSTEHEGNLLTITFQINRNE